MKRVLLWVAGVTVGALLLLALIGYLAGPQKPAADSAQTVTPTSKLSQLKATLESRDLDLCTTYHWLENMEKETRESIEAKRPELNAIDRIQKIDLLRNHEWEMYCKEHRLPDSLRTEINVYGLSECK